MVKTAEGAHLHVFPVPAHWVVDNMEANELTLISPYPHQVSDIATLGRLDTASDPNAPEAPLRTEAVMREACIPRHALKRAISLLKLHTAKHA